MSKDPNKKTLFDEFKEFINKGNAMALAVGTIIGGAFSNITKSVTNDLIMPVVNIFLGGAKFEELKIALPRMPWVEPTYTDVLDAAGNVIGQEEVINYLTWGNFLSAVINFFILSFVVFMIVKFLNKMADLGKKKEEEAPAAPPAPSNEEVLLSEIRDLLKEK
jgi:large conductance mechanosensitive channel